MPTSARISRLGFLFAALFGAGGFMAQGRSPSPLIPILWSAAGIATPLLILIALYYRIAGFERSIPFAGLALLLRGVERLCHRGARQADAASRPRRLRRALRHRHRRRARSGADILAGKRLAHRGARADGAGHRLDRQPAPAARCCAGLPPPRWCWCWRGSAGSRASSAATSAPRRSSTGSSMATACRRSRSGWPGICFASAPTTSRRGWWIARRSCSRC